LLQTLFTISYYLHCRIEQYHVTSHTVNVIPKIHTIDTAHNRYQCISNTKSNRCSQQQYQPHAIPRLYLFSLYYSLSGFSSTYGFTVNAPKQNREIIQVDRIGVSSSCIQVRILPYFQMLVSAQVEQSTRTEAEMSHFHAMPC
jgi:hypothetical protein